MQTRWCRAQKIPRQNGIVSGEEDMESGLKGTRKKAAAAVETDCVVAQD